MLLKRDFKPFFKSCDGLLSLSEDMSVGFGLSLELEPVRCRAFAGLSSLHAVGARGVSELILFAEQTN